MHIQSIQAGTNFKSKPQSISAELRRGMVDLKRKMESETVILKKGISTQIINVRGLDINEKAIFKNGKFLAKRNKNNKLIPYGEDVSMLEFGKARIIAKNSGEIIECKKPFYKSWTKFFQEALDYIQLALDKYNDTHIVKKITHKQDKLTKNGKEQLENEYKNLMNTFNKLNPWSK